MAFSYLLLLLVSVNLAGAFTVSKSPKEIHTSRGRAERNINYTELHLFCPHQSHYRFNNDYSAPKSTQVIKRISQKIKIIRLFISVRISLILEKYKKRYISILAAAMITAGSFPSRSIAETLVKSATMENICVTNIRTSIDSEIKKMIAKNTFLQYDAKAPNNYFEDVDVNNFFDTNSQLVSENIVVQEDDEICMGGKNRNDDESKQAVMGSSFPIYTSKDVTQIQETEDDLMVLNDRMLKSALKNVAIVSSGTAGLIVTRRKVARMNFEEDDNDDSVQVHVQNEHGILFPGENEERTTCQFADCGAGKKRRALNKKHTEARKQPKSPREEAILAARYAAIPTVEERAYQILVDLGMI